MADIEVSAATLEGGRVQQLKVRMPRLDERTIDRDTAVKWMRDGHSLIPVVNGKRGTALQLVEVGDGEWFVRTDNAPTAEDRLPALPKP